MAFNFFDTPVGQTLMSKLKRGAYQPPTGPSLPDEPQFEIPEELQQRLGGESLYNLPPALRQLLMGEITQSRRTGFVPEFEPYSQLLESQIAQIMQQVPIAREQFEGELSRRGIPFAGQGQAAYYNQVVGPAVQAATSATRGTMLDYLKAYQAGSLAEEQVRQQAIDRLLGAEFQEQGIRRTQEAANLDRQLRAVFGEAQISETIRSSKEQEAISREGLQLQWEMFWRDLQQRRRESEQSFWGGLFESIAKGVGYYYGSKGG